MTLEELFGDIRVSGVIISEEVNPEELAINAINTFIVPIASGGIDRVTTNQLKDILNNNPDLSGLMIDDDFIFSISKKIPQIEKIQIDPENNSEMTVYLKNVDKSKSDRYTDDTTKEKEEAQIKKAAKRTLDKKMKK